MSIKYELHFYPLPLSRDVRNQYNCTDCHDSLGIMCIFSLSLIQNPSFLWIITARAESEPANVAEKNPTLFYKLSKQIWLHFADFFSLFLLHPLSFDSLWITWMNLGKAWYTRNLWADPQLVHNWLQKGTAQLHPEDASQRIWKALLEIIHLMWMPRLPPAMSFSGFYLLSQRADNRMGQSPSN